MSTSSPSRPGLAHQPTSKTLTNQQPNVEPNSEVDNPSEPPSEHTPDQDVDKVGHTPGKGPSIPDILSLVGILIMLAWPWAFLGAVWIRGGLQMTDHMAKVVTNNPHATTYFVTLIGSIISMITGALFSLAIIRFAQELVTHSTSTHPFQLRILLAFRHQSWPWGKSAKVFRYLMKKNRWWPAVLLIVCVLTFPHLISSTTSLLSPILFNQTAHLNGTELDFSSTDPICQNWFTQYPLDNNCNWQPYKNTWYTNCLGENQMVDVLESGRGNILELLTNNTQSLTFSQLGAEGGLHFLGPIRGVLPIGPNGAPEFDTLGPSPFSNPKIMAGMASYDYTLNHQGLSSNVSCTYAESYPFHFQPFNGTNRVLTYNVNCTDQEEADVLRNVPVILSATSPHWLVYWACQSATNGTPTDSYSIYLAGLDDYDSLFGNITCTVHPIQTAIFPLTYHSTENIFTAAKPTLEPSPITAFSDFMPLVLTGLGDVISESQNFEANLVAESVITFAVKSFGLQPNESHPLLYLWLFEQMIQGIIEYEATYLRLIYSTISDPPHSCIRTVNGSMKYEVVGWFVTDANIGFLIPITIINMAALIALLIAMWKAKTGGYQFHPYHPRPVTIDENIGHQEQVPDEWRHRVSYHPTTVFREYYHKDVEGNLKKDIQAVKQDVQRHGQATVTSTVVEKQ